MVFGHHFGFGSISNQLTICHGDCHTKGLQLYAVYRMLGKTLILKNIVLEKEWL